MATESKVIMHRADTQGQKLQPQAQRLVQQQPQPVDGNEWGLDATEIEALFATLQTPPRPPARESTVLPPGQVELTEDDLQDLVRIQQKEAEGRTKKVTHSSELHPAVVGHNKSEEKQTQRLLRQWFYEQRYLLDKVGNAQRDTYRQLRLLHVDRRRQARELMNYRREEARTEVERERERQRRAKELALLEKQMEQLRQEEALERQASNNSSRQRLPPLRRVKDKAANVAEASVAAVAAATKAGVEAQAEAEATPPEAAELVAEAAAEKRSMRPSPRNRHDAVSMAPKEEIVTVTAKVVEVERRGMRAARQASGEISVLERSRSKSFIREPVNVGLPAVQPTQQQQQPKQPQQPQHPQTTQQPPPPLSQAPAPIRWKKARGAAPVEEAAVEPTPKPAQPPQPIEKSPKPAERAEAAPQTQVERNRLRAKRRAKASQRMLLEPFRHYRMTRLGVIEPVEFQPPKFPTTEPTNRPLYEQHKRLERERAGYVASMNRLGQFTAEVLNEDIRLADAFEQPKEKQSKSGPPKELRLGPSDWMKVFLRTNAPEDVEAGSFEAMKYIEYLRPEAPNTDRDIEPEKLFDDL